MFGEFLMSSVPAVFPPTNKMYFICSKEKAAKSIIKYLRTPIYLYRVCKCDVEERGGVCRLKSVTQKSSGKSGGVAD